MFNTLIFIYKIYLKKTARITLNFYFLKNQLH